MANPEVSSVPSGYKRKKSSSPSGEDASKPYAPLPSPRPSVNFERDAIIPETRAAQRSSGSWLPFFVAMLALIIAIASAYTAFITQQEILTIKKDARSLADDLRALRDNKVSFHTTASSTARIFTEVPLRDAMKEPIGLSVNEQVPLSGSGKALLPTIGVVDVVFNATVPVSQTFYIYPVQIPESSSLKLSQNAPLSADMTIEVSPGQLWGQQIDGMISKLDGFGR